jgi:hypothetical protein
MKPFNLEEALSGKPVVTRQGLPVTKIVHFENTHNDYQLFGVVDNQIESWTIQGKYYKIYDSHNKDLFMLPEKKSIWVNVYEGFDNEIVLGTQHPTSDRAKSQISSHNTYIKTIEITNEP